MDFARCWSTPRKRHCNALTITQFRTQQQSKKVMNYLAGNARMNRKKVLGLETKGDIEENLNEMNPSVPKGKNELTSALTLATTSIPLDTMKFDTAFKDVNGKIREMELSLHRLQGVSVDDIVGTKFNDYDEKVKVMLKDNEKSMYTSLQRMMKRVIVETGKNTELVVSMLNEAMENKMEEVDKLVNDLDCKIQRKFRCLEENVKDRLEAEEESTQCFIADFDFKFQGLERKVMRSLTCQLELGSKYGDEVTQKDARTHRRTMAKGNGRGCNRQHFGER